MCVTEGAAGLVIAAADSRALVAPIKRALGAGLKVASIDVQMDQGAMTNAGIADKVPFVGPDNVAAAQGAGDELAKELPAGAKVALIDGIPGAANAAQRTQGFKNAIQQHHLNIVAEQTAHWETTEAQTVFSSMLSAHPDIQGAFAGNDDMALGVLKAVQDQGKAGKIRIASFDNIPAIHPYLQNGMDIATVDQFANDQASAAMDVVMKMLGGQTVTGWQKTPTKIVTKANA